MNDRELADKVVAIIDLRNIRWWSSDYQFVRDWRVAGALIVKIHDNANRRITIATSVGPYTYYCTVSAYFGSNDLPKFTATNNSLPHAIIEACVGSLES